MYGNSVSLLSRSLANLLVINQVELKGKESMIFFDGEGGAGISDNRLSACEL